MKLYFKLLLLITLLICSMPAISQETDNNEIDNSSYVAPKKGFRLGLYVGSYFANQYTANMYDGYGFDIDGNKNSWDNSLMNQKINMEYGGKGYAGQTDQIALALNVDPQTGWTFDESDMPTNVRYNPSFAVGLDCIYSVDVKNAIIFNVNLAKINSSGNFTIVTPQQNNTTQINDRIKTFSIRGSEQRMLLQFGYQRILGDNEKVNFFVEGGLHFTLAKYDKNEILINTLKIDLTSYYNNVAYSSALILKKPIGTGMGVFGGIGTNLTINPKFTIQLLYSPTYERINIGINPRLKLQHAIGLRVYYNF
ncbi:MAG: hypothetical protein V4608_12375 [Bacteroidota bacterium]